MKKLSYIIASISLIIAVFFLFNITTHAKASEIEHGSDYIKVNSYEIIQEGNFPKKEEPVMTSMALGNSSEDTVSIAAETIEKTLRNRDKSALIPVQNFNEDLLFEAFAIAVNNNPEFFYVSSSYNYRNPTNVTPYYEFIPTYKDNADSMLQEYINAIEHFKKGVNRNWTDLEKLIYINDYIDKLCEYDESTNREQCHNAYGALVEHIAVCQGYMLAFNALAKSIGIESYSVTSSKLHHGWNMVKLNGHYYMIDSTWNDPIADHLGNARHTYFLKSYSWFNTEKGKHVSDDYYVTNTSLEPDFANDTRYDSYVWDTVKSGFEYVNGKWYAIYDVNGDNKNVRIYSFTCDGTNWNRNSSYIMDLSSLRWYVFDNSGQYYYINSSCSLASFNGTLIYTNPIKILSYNPANGSTSTLYTLTSSESNSGYIYGISKTVDDKLRYCISKSPNSDDLRNAVIKDLSLNTSNIDYVSPTITITVDSSTYTSLNTQNNTVKYTASKIISLNSTDDRSIISTWYYYSDSYISPIQIKLLSEKEWVKGSGSYSSTFSIPDEYSECCYIYARTIDSSGNIGYASSGKIIYDGIPPIIETENSETIFYEEADVRISDKNLYKIYLNGISAYITNGILKVPAAEEPQEIKATDIAGNTTILVITVIPVTYDEPIFEWSDDYKSATVTFNSHPDVLTKVFNDEMCFRNVIKKPTCMESGTAEYLCSVEFKSTWYSDSRFVEIEPTGHTPEKEAVKENEINPTYNTEGSYDSVLYCSSCHMELSREHIKTSKLPLPTIPSATNPPANNTTLIESSYVPDNTLSTTKTIKLLSLKCKKNTKKISGKLSVSGAQVTIKVGTKTYKKVIVKGKSFTLKLSYKLKKKTRIIITVSKNNYTKLKKTKTI